MAWCRRSVIDAPSAIRASPTSEILAPNDLWAADFKGHFKTGDGLYCYPLTVTDGYSRFLLGCQGLQSTAMVRGQTSVHPLFKEYGLP